MENLLFLGVPILKRIRVLFHCFSEKIRLDISCESSARQRIHMKHQALFPLKGKSEKIKCCLLQFMFGALRVCLKRLPSCTAPYIVKLSSQL